MGIRRGIYFHITTSCGRTTITESAPLEGFSIESYEDAVDESTKIIQEFQGYNLVEHFNLSDLSHLLPCNRWALYAGFMDLIDPTKPQPIKTCGYLNPPNFDHLEGFTSVKVKFQHLNFDQAFSFFQTHLKQLEKIQLRLDCNQSKQWSCAQMEKLLEQFPSLQIEFVEEPFFTSNTKKTNTFKIALDESLRQKNTQPLFLQESVWVVKPMLDFELITPLLRRDKKALNSRVIILSSSYETEVGMYHLAKLCTRLKLQSTMGLDTLKLFERVAHPPLNLQWSVKNNTLLFY